MWCAEVECLVAGELAADLRTGIMMHPSITHGPCTGSRYIGRIELYFSRLLDESCGCTWSQKNFLNGSKIRRREWRWVTTKAKQHTFEYYLVHTLRWSTRKRSAEVVLVFITHGLNKN